MKMNFRRGESTSYRLIPTFIIYAILHPHKYLIYNTEQAYSTPTNGKVTSG